MSRLNRTPNEWHLDRRLSIGLLLSIILLFITVVSGIVSGFLWAKEVDIQMAFMKEEITALSERSPAAEKAETRVTTLETEHRILFSQIQRQLAEMNNSIASLALAVGTRNENHNQRPGFIQPRGLIAE